MWWRKKSTGEGTRYGVLVHARNLTIPDDHGVMRVGGAYMWHDVIAANPEAATRAAIESLVDTPAFVEEVQDLEKALADAVADEIVVLKPEAPKRESAVMFYIDTDSPDADEQG